MVTTADPAIKARIDSERNQGRAPDMQWLDHDRLGFNYRMSDIACALGIAQLGRLDDMLASRAQVAAWYREALAGLVDRTGLELLCEDRGGARRSWFVYVVRVPRSVDRDATIARLAERGSRPGRTCRRSTSSPSTASASASARPVPRRRGRRGAGLSLPFFPGMTQDQVATVVAELTAVLTGD